MRSRNNEEIKYGPRYGLNLDLLIIHTNSNYGVSYPTHPKKSPKLGPYRCLEGREYIALGDEDRVNLNVVND